MKTDSRPTARIARWARWRQASQVLFLLLALYVAVRHALHAAAPTVEASCPFGAIETVWSVVAKDAFLRSIGHASGFVLAGVLLLAIGLGRVFCGWACPVGSLQSGLAWVSRRLLGRRGIFPLSPPCLGRSPASVAQGRGVGLGAVAQRHSRRPPTGALLPLSDDL